MADTLRPPRGGPSEALFHESETLAPIPLVAPPAQARPDPYVRCANPALPPRPRASALAKLPPDRDDITQEHLGDVDATGGSPGTACQLLAVGAQNYVLDLNPQTTFFRQVYRRHTDFATECCEHRFDLRLGGYTTVELPRRGDLLADVVLQITLPDLGIPGGAWVDAAGYALLTRVRFVIGEQVVHDHERLFYDITDRLLMPHGRLAGVDAMIGRGRALPTDRAHTLFVPLKLLCCKGHYKNQQFLPIGALATNTKLELVLGAESLGRCLRLPPDARAPARDTLACALLSDQVFVGQDEQRALRLRGSTMLVETVQDVDDVAYQFDDNGTYGVSSVRLDLRELNLPVKMLAFVAYDENDAGRGLYFRYLDCVKHAALFIDSAERFSLRAGAYFSLVQTYQHCTRSSADLVHAYSFALDCAERQPSGAVNFAVLDRPVLRVELQNTGGAPVKVKCFAYCYNWLEVRRGMAGFRFTS